LAVKSQRMQFGGMENKARLAVALLVLALLLTIGMSLTLYSQASRELAAQQAYQVKVEAAMLAAMLAADKAAPSDDSLQTLLARNNLQAAAALYATDGKPLARASTIDPPPASELLRPQTEAANRRPLSAADAPQRNQDGFDVAEVAVNGSTIFVLAKPEARASSPLVFYVFSYQIVALVIGLGLIFLFVRRMLSPYRRLVEVARGSPVRAPSAVSESEFVLETFQAVIDNLQAKEKELAQLHEVERRRAERSERFSERVISNIPSGLVAINTRGQITSANPRAIAIFNPPPETQSESGNGAGPEPMPSDYREFFRAAPRMVEMLADCLEHGVMYRRAEVEVTQPDGGVRHLGLSISPIADAAQNVEGALCLMTDLTEVIELRERMKLQENLANLGEMAAGLAHEFKNSLATIHGYIQFLEAQTESASPSDGRRRALDATLTEVRLLARLVTDFLNFARPEHYNMGPVNLRELLEDCLEEARPQLERAGIKARMEGRFTTLTGDETLLRRAFVNLIRNAAEAIDPQSPNKQIVISGSVDTGTGGRYAHIRIKDTGSGISQQDLQRIFIPFFTTKSRGYGIGLAIVQKILVGHGGNVAVEKSDASGTVFHCRLPLFPPAAVVEKP
ncbi:MAG TPA: ATP-binding protein, partial [Blastocatellia bacterium]|nr:ATP-binding protein [Blastocatellia bacterium]